MKVSTEAFANIKGKSGIYAISHISSGKVYIGSSKNLLKRWMQHKALLKKGTHHSWKLQADWNAYGENSFDIFILEEVEKHSDLLQIEQLYLDKYESYKKGLGYNIFDTTTPPFAKGVMKPENKLKEYLLSLSEEAKVNTEELCAKSATGSIPGGELRGFVNFNIEYCVSLENERKINTDGEKELIISFIKNWVACGWLYYMELVSKNFNFEDINPSEWVDIVLKHGFDCLPCRPNIDIKQHKAYISTLNLGSNLVKHCLEDVSLSVLEFIVLKSACYCSGENIDSFISKIVKDYIEYNFYDYYNI